MTSVILTNDIIAYENGELDEQEVIDLFQRLVFNGLAWRLQGHYGRTAMALLKAGLIELPPEANNAGSHP